MVTEPKSTLQWRCLEQGELFKPLLRGKQPLVTIFKNHFVLNDGLEKEEGGKIPRVRFLRGRWTKKKEKDIEKSKVEVFVKFIHVCPPYQLNLEEGPIGYLRRFDKL